jgi:glycosyltransferase involved in cell wall biosynthesis
MHILIAHLCVIPATKYGGTERVIWWLGKKLVQLGHEVTYLVAKKSVCPFAKVLFFDPKKPLDTQIPAYIDVVHFHFEHQSLLSKPHLTTIHGNATDQHALPINSVFLSQNHAERHGSDVFVHNGLDFEEYGTPNLTNERHYFHFLGKAAWRTKNVRGAIEITRLANEELVVLGGSRLNFSMGFRFTPYLHVHFKGMVGGAAKNELINHSRGLIFPVLWHEPFGLAVVESLYFGAPVFATPYGSLPALVPNSVGVLSPKVSELVYALQNADNFDRKTCHEHVINHFSAEQMAKEYTLLYEKILRKENLHAQHPCLQVIPKDKYLPFL